MTCINWAMSWKVQTLQVNQIKNISSSSAFGKLLILLALKNEKKNSEIGIW